MHRRSPSRAKNEELSLRHFPDDSDMSLTFQIPTDAGTESRLLDEDSGGFFNQLEDSFETSVPPRPTQSPLRLSDLTPRKEMTSNLRDTISTTISTEPFQPPPDLSTSSPRRRTRAPREDVNSTVDASPSRYNLRSREPRDSPTKTDTPKEDHPKTIVKPLFGGSKDSEALKDPKPRAVKPSKKTRPSKAQVSDVGKKGEASGGVVERLLQYGGQLEQDTIYSSNVAIPEPTPASDACPPVDMAVDDKGPLTLSQVSPRKREMPAETVAPPLPPTRNTRKRPAPATEDTEQTAVKPRDRKQGSKLRGEGPSKRLKTTHLPSKPSSSAGRAPTTKRRISARLQKQGHVSQGSTSKKAPTRSSSRSQGHRDHTAVHGQTDQIIPAGRKPGLLTESSKSGKLPASTTLPPPKPTIPFEFRFTVDHRLQTRKHEPQEDTVAKPHPPLPVPDFKALHAAEAEAAALRKEHIHPTVPVPLGLTTEARSRERQKFDEMVREKEEEIERQREERRRQKEAEEQAEIKELRKKAIPRAHEVPAWYSQAPKRRTEGTH